MARVTLEQLEGIESITLKLSTGETVLLKKGEPALIKDPDRHLVAAVQRLPVRYEEDAGESSAQASQQQRQR